MQAITIIESISTGIYPEFDKVFSVEIEDNFFESGNFGEVYICASVNKEIPSVHQVVKILKDNEQNSHIKGIETVRKLQEKLKQKHQETLRNKNQTLFDDYPALKAVPQFSFEGELNGKRVYGYSSNDLTRLGFISFSQILKDEAQYEKYEQEFITAKFKLAYHLVNVFDLFQSIFFVHADIKAEAVFVNMKRQELAVIDFDSGALMVDSNDQPTTCGTMQGWLAPEIREQLNQSNRQKEPIRVNILSDLWSVIEGIHYLLFLEPPFFFLKEIKSSITKEYFSHNHWPNADMKADYFNEKNKDYYEYYIEKYKNLIPNKIKEIFEESITYGYHNATMRKSYSSWKIALKATQKAPEIKLFKADKYIREDTSEITLSWSVENASRIVLMPNQIELKNRKQFQVQPLQDTTYTLIAHNPLGKVEEILVVEVSRKPPVIDFFKANKDLRNNADPITLCWQVENAHRLILNPENIDVTNRLNVEVKPLDITTYTLLAESFFGIKAEKSLTVKVSKEPPIIENFEYEAIDPFDNTFKLSWEVIDAEHICILPFLGDVSDKNETEICLTDQNVFTITAKTLFGVTTSKTISLSTLFNITPPDSLFNKEPGESIFNLEINPEIFNQFKMQNHGNTKN